MSFTPDHKPEKPTCYFDECNNPVNRKGKCCAYHKPLEKRQQKLKKEDEQKEQRKKNKKPVRLTQIPTYSTSDGERFTKSQIETKVQEAKQRYTEQFIDDHGYVFCERTKAPTGQIDRSHIISVKYAQETGRSELAWDLDNLELLTRDEHSKLEDWPNAKREAWYFARKEGMNIKEFLTIKNK